MAGTTCLLDAVNPWSPHVDGISVLCFLPTAYRGKLETCNSGERWRVSPHACPASAVVAVWPTGLRLGTCSCRWTKHSLGPGHFFWMSETLLSCEGKPVPSPLQFFPRPCGRGQSLPAQACPQPCTNARGPRGPRRDGGCRPRLAVAPCRPRGCGQQLSPGLRAPSGPHEAAG